MTPLLPSPLVGDGAAVVAMRALVATSPTPIATRCTCIAAGLRLAAQATQEQGALTLAALANEPIVVDGVTVLAKATAVVRWLLTRCLWIVRQQLRSNP